MPNPFLEYLRKRSEFLTVASAKEHCAMPAFIIQIYQRASEGPVRYGITASRKIGGAVERSRAKRRLRALINKTLPILGHQGTDYVLIARSEILKRDFNIMEQELKQALIKLHQKGKE